MRHLDQKLWSQYLSGALSPQVAEDLSEHLEQGCEQCELFLAERGGDDGIIDGLVDETLLQLSQHREQQFDEVGFQRFWRAVQQEKPGWRKTGWRKPGLFVGLAAAAAIAFFVTYKPSEPYRLKGAGPQVERSVQLQVMSVVDGEPLPLQRGAKIPLGTTLVFEVELKIPGCVQLWRQSEPRQALLAQPVCLEVGHHVLQRDQEVLGLATNSRGRLLFYAGLAKAGEQKLESDIAFSEGHFLLWVQGGDSH